MKESHAQDFPGSPVVRFSAFMAEGPGSISGQELRYCKLCGMSKKKQKKQTESHV